MVELIYLFFICVVAIGSGRRLLRWLGVSNHSMAEELAFSFGLGMGALAVGVMLLGLAHLLYEGALYLLLLGYGIAGSKELSGLRGRLKGRMHWGGLRCEPFYLCLALAAALVLLLNLARALTPAHGAVDPLAYHLALPKIFLKKHYLSFEPTITGALYPSNISMLFTLGIGLRGEILAQLLHFSMGVACLFFILSFCRRYFDKKVGLWAAAIFGSMPVVIFFMPLGYVDVGVCFFQFLGFWALFNWLATRDDRALLLAGLLTGLALGAKHPALPMWFVGMGIVTAAGLRRRAPWAELARHWGLFGGVALCLLMPWYLRSFLAAGNPVWPLANDYFHGLPYRGSFNVGAAPAGATGLSGWFPSAERFKDLVYGCAVALWEWSWNTANWQKAVDWQRAIGGQLIAFLPGLLLYVRRRQIALLAAFCLLYYLIVVIYVDGNPRYSLFLFAYLSIAAGYAAEQLTRGALHRLKPLLQGVFCLTLFFNVLVSYALAQTAIGFLTSGNSREQFLLEQEGNARVFSYVNQHLPESAVVLLQGDVKGYYCDRDYLWDHPYQMVINYRQYDTAENLLKRMRELGISHVVRMIYIPPIRTQGVGYPQYFADAFHEEFRKKYLRLLYRDESYALFEVVYLSGTESPSGE